MIHFVFDFKSTEKEKIMSIQLAGIEMGNVVPGAQRLGIDDSGINETYLGSVQTQTEVHRAYIKVLPPKELVNELLACVLGRSMGFPLLEGFLLRVRSQDIPDSALLAQFPDSECLVFGSKASEAPTLLRRLNHDWAQAFSFLQKVRFDTWDEVIVFDDWIANFDRHPGNLLIEPEGRVYWIDHSHSFTDADWDATQLDCRHVYGNFVGESVATSLGQNEKAQMVVKASRMAQSMTQLALDSVGTVSHVDQILTTSDLDAISDFVVNRVPYLQSIMQQRLGLPYQPALGLIP